MKLVCFVCNITNWAVFLPVAPCNQRNGPFSFFIYAVTVRETYKKLIGKVVSRLLGSRSWPPE